MLPFYSAIVVSISSILGFRRTVFPHFCNINLELLVTKMLLYLLKMFLVVFPSCRLIKRIFLYRRLIRLSRYHGKQ